MKTTAALALAGLAAADGVVPPANTVKIGSISYGGSGCPQGSVGSFISADRSTYTLIFDSYVASIGPGKGIQDSRKNCQINVDLLYPSGYQFSVYSQNYRGFVQLDKGVVGTQRATFYFSGASAQASTSTNFQGPESKDYLITDSIPFSSNVFSPCGQEGALNINTQISLDNSGNPQGSGQLTTDSIDGKVTLKYGLQWQTCNSALPSEYTGTPAAATYNGGAGSAPPPVAAPPSVPSSPPYVPPPVDVPPPSQPAYVPPPVQAPPPSQPAYVPPPVQAPPPSFPSSPAYVPPPPPTYVPSGPPPSAFSSPPNNFPGSPPPDFPPPSNFPSGPPPNSGPPPSGGFGGFGPAFGNGDNNNGGGNPLGGLGGLLGGIGSTIGSAIGSGLQDIGQNNNGNGGFGGFGGFGPAFGNGGGFGGPPHRDGPPNEGERRRRECRRSGGEWIQNQRHPDGFCRRGGNGGQPFGFRSNNGGPAIPF